MIDRRQLGELALLLQGGGTDRDHAAFSQPQSDDDVHQKSGPLDLVTVADEAAERMITAGLRKMFPGCVVVGEEATAADPGLLDGLPRRAARVRGRPDRRHIANYAAGLPLFGCMAAALECMARSWRRRSSIRSATTSHSR